MVSSRSVVQDTGRAISGKIFVFSGKLLSFSRREAAALVRLRGGHTRRHVTRRTSYLVVGEDLARGSRSGGSRKLVDARRLEQSGVSVRVIDENDFLEMFGLESASRLRSRYYSSRDVRRLYGLESNVLRQLERLSVVSPILKTNAERYYTFSDLLVLRQVHDARERGASLHSIARRLLQARTGQMRIDFECENNGESARVIPLEQQSTASWTADDWYNLGCEHDENPLQRSEAIAAYRHALKLDPYHVGALINLGNLLYDKGDIAEARRSYERALASDADNAVAHFNLGNVHDDLGEYEQAIDYFQKAILLRPQNADAHFNLGLVYDRIGRVDDVRRHMQQYLRLNPLGDMAEIAREYLQLTENESADLDGQLVD